MDWFPVVIALSTILVIREIRLWWLLPIHAPQAIGTQDAIGGGTATDVVAEDWDESEPRPDVMATGQDALSSNNLSDSPPPYAQKRTMVVNIRTRRNKSGNLRAEPSAFPAATGFLSHSHDFVLNQPIMYINETQEKVLQWLARSTMSGAEFDARGHPPSCHPGTRITILETLYSWIDDVECPRSMLWLHGPAGVGKSAIIQSLAEELANSSKLGATLFFSRPNRRDNSALVLPTIAYQLAVRIPRYKEYIRQKMIEDPKLLEKDMIYQFDIFIVKPFTIPNLVTQRRSWVILLDGLDECYGEEAQVLILRLISYFVRHYPKTPLVWLVASRPEAHLQHAFASGGIRGFYDEHDVPANSDDACRDVEKFLRAKFEEIHQTYKDLMPVGAPWPVEHDISRVSKASSGLFTLATTVIRYIEDPHVCDPISQLAIVVSITKGLEPGSLSALYAFYSAILDGVSPSVLPILKLLLYLYVAVGTSAIFNAEDNSDGHEDGHPLAFVASVLDLQQHIVYSALRKLHSVVKVPPPEKSGHQGIKFYHTSFPDYLKAASADYTFNTERIVIKQWSGLLNMLYGGDSSLYQRAMSDNRPSSRPTWGLPWADSLRDSIWERGIYFLFHNLMPECPNPGDFGHSQVSRTSTELQNFFEGVDFSALLFRERHETLFSALFGLFEWLMSDPPSELMQSNLVKIIPLKQLDSGLISKEKLSHEFEWTSYQRRRVDDVQGPRQRQFHRAAGYRDTFRYTDASPETLHSDWHGTTNPVEGLVTKLDQLRSDDPELLVLIIGKGPSRRCAFISVEPQSEKLGAFIYLPYGQK